jgi:hypothetical protein
MTVLRTGNYSVIGWERSMAEKMGRNWVQRSVKVKEMKTEHH